MPSKTSFTICMFSNLYPPVHSGSSMQCTQLARELARRGWKVIVITARVDPRSREFEIRDGVDIHRIPAMRLPRLPIALNFPWLTFTFTRANTRRILKILENNPPNVIHLHNHMFDMALHAVGMARRFAAPLVVTVHTIIRHPNMIYDRLLKTADRLILKPLVIRRADVLICPDRIIQEYVKQTFEAEKTVLIPYGIRPLPEPDPEKMRAVREKYGLGAGPVILSLGHLHEVRNRKELIAILPKLVTRYPNLKVLIVGDVGTDLAENLAIRLGVRDHLVLTGAVPHPELAEYLGIAHIEATWFDRSHPHKSLGIAAREAMAAGKTVFATVEQDVYGEGVLRDGENMILIDPDDLPSTAKRFIELLSDTEKRRAIGNQANRAIREHFSWENVCNQTIRVYQGLFQ